MIYVYENKNGFRVVRGNNPTRAKEHLNLEPRVYTDEKSAYAVETNSAIKGAILRLDPSVAEGITPVSQHHVIKNSAKLRRVHMHHFNGLSFIILFVLIIWACSGNESKQS